jgi:hypothetical protein
LKKNFSSVGFGVLSCPHLGNVYVFWWVRLKKLHTRK